MSDAPSPAAYTYTYDHLAQTMSDLLDQLKVTQYTMYLHDYGAPIGFRILLAHPDQLHALIIQNGNIYKAGLEAKWANIAMPAARTSIPVRPVSIAIPFSTISPRFRSRSSPPTASAPPLSSKLAVPTHEAEAPRCVS